MLKAYKYKLNLTGEQRVFMNKSFGCARVVYNYCLNQRIEAYEKDKSRISSFDLCKQVVALKNTFSWLREVDHQTLCCSVMNLDKAYKRFFKEKKGFPKHKSKHNKQSCQFTQGVDIDFDKELVRFPKIGWVKLHLSRKFDGKIKTTTVSRNACGMYFVSILVENGLSLPEKISGKAIGIDVGLKHFATLSNGEKIDNPKYYESELKRLAVLQRRLSNKIIGSNNRNKARIKVARCYYKISCKRNDFLHKLSTSIVRDNQTVVIEDLNVKGMMQNDKLSKSIGSASWSMFFDMLDYKCAWYGKELIKIDRFEPSSKKCSVCGEINHDLTLSDREWTCKCGTNLDRDLNAAINIKNAGAGSPGEPAESRTKVRAAKQEVYSCI